MDRVSIIYVVSLLPAIDGGGAGLDLVHARSVTTGQETA